VPCCFIDEQQEGKAVPEAALELLPKFLARVPAHIHQIEVDQQYGYDCNPMLGRKQYEWAAGKVFAEELIHNEWPLRIVV